MKQMKTRMTRIAAVLMSLMMLLSSLVLPATAAPLLDDSNNSYGISYADGIYTVSINAETLADLLQSESFDKQALLQVMPASLYNFLVTRDANSALAVLKDLYAASDLGALKNDLPVHIITDKFTKEDLLSVVKIDKVMEIIDVNALIDSVPADEIWNLFKDGALGAYILQNYAQLTVLITDEVVNKVLSTLTAFGANLANYLKADAVDTLSQSITLSKYIKAENALDLITGTDPLITSDEINALLTKDVINEMLSSIDVAALLNNENVYNAIVTDSFIATVVADDEVIANVKSNSLVTQMGINELVGYAKDPNWKADKDSAFMALTTDTERIDYLLDNVVDVAAIAKANFDKLGLSSFLPKFVTADMVVDNLDVVLAADKDNAILSAALKNTGVMNGIITLLETKDCISDLISAGVIDINAVVNDVETTVLVECIDTTRVPMDIVISAIGTDVIVDYFMTNDPSGLVSLVDFKYVLSMDAFKDSLKGVTKDELMAAIDVEKIKSDLLPTALDAFLGYIYEIRLNDVVVYSDRALDMTATEYAVAASVPTPADIVNVGDDGVVASFILSYDVYDSANNQWVTYTNGFNVALVGDTTEICNYASKIDAMVQMGVNYLGSDSIGYDFVINAPEKLAELYVTSLTNAELSQELRDKLFGIGNATLEPEEAEAAVDALLNKLTLDELRNVLSSIELGGYNQVILDKLNMYESQAETIRLKLIEVLDRVLTAVVDSNTANEIYGKTLADFYEGNGRFILNLAFTLEIPVPEQAQSLVVNNVITHNVGVDATFADLYQVQFVDGESVLYTAYRTEGYALAELFDLAEVQLEGVTKWMDIDTKTVVDPAALTMPAGDLTLTPVRSFTATFVVDGEIIGTDEFDPADPTTLNFPTTANRLHYTLVWDDYTLEYADITINGYYVPTMYTATFMNGDNLWAIRMYSFETLPAMFMPELPVAPIGYVASWSFPFLPLADITIDVVYTPITYYVTFVDADGNEIAKVPFTVENIEIEYPEVPKKDGYIGTWPELTADMLLDVDYYYENELSFDREVAPIYDSNTYYVTFVDKDGETVAKVPYSVGDTEVDEPAVPAVKGYTNGKWADYTLGAEDITVAPVYELETYYITFVGMDGKTVQKVAFDIEDTKITEPAVPAVKGYKAGKWNSYKLLDEAVYTKTGSYDQKVEASYDLETYYITFVDKDGKQVAKVEFNIKSTSIKAPAVPALDGYTGAWASYKLLDETVYSKTGSYNQTVKPEYTAIGEEKTYTATFVADGKEVAKVTFKATDTKLTEPAVPAKDGYMGKWDSYKLGAADITINAVYTAIEYTVTFVADGTTVGTAKYTVENKSITEPAVPEKEGYTGKWESYTLTTGDVTVNAVYTAVDEVVEPESSLLWLWILIAVVAAGGIAVAVVFIIKKKKAAPKA
ncbi:MAG: InlB B-repeat-containing protein [Clostridia bacterium]|nr:InlB B-repeat-containing protein [Clostridia bacterium]